MPNLCRYGKINCMDTAITISKNELDSLKNEVEGLKKTVLSLIKLLKKEKIIAEDINPDELMCYAAKGFNVTSETTEDDDNIADPTKIKPIDWSKYA